MSKKKSYTNNEQLDKLIDWMFKIVHIEKDSTKQLMVKIVKFVIVGGIATIISGITFFLLDTFTHISVLISNTIAFLVAVVYNYWASCKYVFEVNKEKSAAQRFTEFMIFSIIGYGINQVLLWTFIWAIFATFTNYFLGMIVAMLINKKGIKFKKLWRSILVFTIAVPQFVSLLLTLILMD